MGFGLAAVAAEKAFAGEKWKYEDKRTPEQIKADSLYWAQKQYPTPKARRKTKPEYIIRIEFAKPEVQTKDTVFAVPIQEKTRKEIPFWLGIGLLGFGALGVAGAGLSIAYKLKNRKFENGEPVATFPNNWSGEFPEYLPIRLYVYYPYKLKAIVSSALVGSGVLGAYLLSNSSETKTRYAEQVAQVVVEPVPYIMEKDSSGARFIINTPEGFDSMLLFLSGMDLSGKKIKVFISGAGADSDSIRQKLESTLQNLDVVLPGSKPTQ
jgi:hypothetical protein